MSTNLSEHATFSNAPALKDRDFQRIQKFLFEKTGIHLSDVKKTLVASRLYSRLKVTGYSDYGSYYSYVESPSGKNELTHFLDALTTNETYFFREPEHFNFLSALVKENRSKTDWKLWSAASSSGEEVYSLAMLLSDDVRKPNSWHIHGSDLSTKVIAKAQQGHYPIDRNEGISPERLRKYCLKGTGKQVGTFLIDRDLTNNITFFNHNLLDRADSLGFFDVVFLRNVMIYFNPSSKQEVLNNVLRQLKPGGYFFISHTESLMNMKHELKQIKPSIYRKV